MPRLSEVDRHRALGLLQAGLPISKVFFRINVNRTTIFRLRQRLHETDTVSDRPRSGRPRCTTQRQDRNLVRNHINNRFLSASASSRQTRGRNNQRISANTVTRRLSISGLRARRPCTGPILTQRHRHQRTLWAQEHAAWDCIQWRSVVFSDESRFYIDHADGHVGYVYGEEAVKDAKQIALGNTTGTAKKKKNMKSYIISPHASGLGGTKTIDVLRGS
ncbi:transposable element Tc1 transposase [Elysia marginata]|uniref:Transposable element Tc1 transposase n=1 Tax=Elysia marginata TaxID=1093978 RepID=A0AAV4FVI2_9GAST|nr:transposable element Tc1 transposase [Elysia marginata]